MIHQSKTTLLEGAAGIFERGGKAAAAAEVAEDTLLEARVLANPLPLLAPKILRVEKGRPPEHVSPADVPAETD